MLTKNHNYYYAQMFISVPDHKYSIHRNIIVFADNKNDATDLANTYAYEQYPNATKVDLHLYLKNYIRDARQMVEAGDFIGEKPADV